MITQGVYETLVAQKHFSHIYLEKGGRYDMKSISEWTMKKVYSIINIYIY